MTFLALDQLNKSFGDVRVLQEINIEVEKGSFLVLVGPSGCGKSTLLNTIAGIETISSGDIRIDGVSIVHEHPSRRDIAMVFQSYALYPNMTVEQNIAFGMEIRKVPRPERIKAVQDVANTLQIGHLLDRKPAQLSGGQRQRVAMGRALVRNPRVFLFDEPLSNLDAKLRVDMRLEIKRLHQRLGASIVYVTHDQMEAMTLATHIAVLRDGVLQQFGDPRTIYNAPSNLFVADFMGSPSMNLLRVRVIRNDQGSGLMLRCSPSDGQESIVLPLPASHSTVLQRYEDQEVIFGLRPEALTDLQSSDRQGQACVRVDCRIEVVEPAGSDTYAVTNVGEVAMTARLGANVDVTPGQILTLVFDMSRAVFFDPDTQQAIG